MTYKAPAFFLLLMLLSLANPFPVSQQSTDKKDKGRQRALPVVISQYSQVRKPAILATPESKSLDTDATIISHGTMIADTKEQQAPQPHGAESVNAAATTNNQGQPEADKPEQKNKKEESDTLEPVVPQKVDSSLTSVPAESASISKTKDTAEKEKNQQEIDKLLQVNQNHDSTSQKTMPSPSNSNQEKPEETSKQDSSPIVKDAGEITSDTPSVKPVADGDHKSEPLEKERDQESSAEKEKPETNNDSESVSDRVDDEEKIAGEKLNNEETPQVDSLPDISASSAISEKKTADKEEHIKEEKIVKGDMTDNHMTFNLPIGELFEEDRSFKSSVDEFSQSAFEKRFDNEGATLKDIELAPKTSSAEDLDNMNDNIRLERDDKKNEDKKSDVKEKEKEKTVEKEKLLGKPIYKETKPSKQSKPVIAISDDPVQEYDRIEAPKKGGDGELEKSTA